MSTVGVHQEERPRSDPIFEINNLKVNFEMDRGRSQVVDDISVDIYRNERFGIVGESGSGKSMFAEALLDAVVDPGRTTGEITYYPRDGEPIDVLNLSGKELKRYRWEEVSIVFQGALSSFNPIMKIGEHFVETIQAHNADLEDRLDYVYELMDDLYLDPDQVMDSYPHELSGGMTQRALIALSLVLEPEVLIMDEPTAALDLLMQRSIVNLILQLQEELDLTLIFISHDLALTTDLVERLAVMYAFQFVEIGPTDRVVSGAAHPYTRALLNAVPNIDASREQMQQVPGESPDPVNIPVGCSYHPRCPLADERCQIEEPDLLHTDDTGVHRVACYYWEQAEDEIPLAHQNSGI